MTTRNLDPSPHLVPVLVISSEQAEEMLLAASVLAKMLTTYGLGTCTWADVRYHHGRLTDMLERILAPTLLLASKVPTP